MVIVAAVTMVTALGIVAAVWPGGGEPAPTAAVGLPTTGRVPTAPVGLPTTGQVPTAPVHPPPTAPVHPPVTAPVHPPATAPAPAGDPDRRTAADRPSRGGDRRADRPERSPAGPEPGPATDPEPAEPRPAPGGGGEVVATGSCEASYYWEPQPTASGEVFDPEAMTAAHLTLDFDTRVRVTNPATGHSVIVRINDRGPYVDGRCLDLSRGAFGKIASLDSGVVTVTYEVLSD